MQDYVRVACPACGRKTSASIDVYEDGVQSFTEDCQNCCHPILFTVILRGGEVVETHAERESD
jgi:hypothetical protein